MGIGDGVDAGVAVAVVPAWGALPQLAMRSGRQAMATVQCATCDERECCLGMLLRLSAFRAEGNGVDYLSQRKRSPRESHEQVRDSPAPE